ncbi:ABC transporter permease [Aquipseudomonas alcaligenes]|uniref:ABC transporter permease n=1 Tax=Aquipseudomonas alcaligenes TaxID=43263 RepID=UPI00374A4171
MTKQVTVLSAQSRRGLGYWRELATARELLLFLAWRDVLVKYKQAALGIAWAILRPVLTTVVFTLVFGKLAGLSSGDVPYSLLVFSGMVPWLYFAGTVTECGNSLVSNSALITKVYFPRLVVPMSSVLANLIDLSITSLLLCALLLWFGVDIGWHILLVPVVFAVLIMLTVGLGLFLAALNAKYRDVSFILPFLMTMGVYLSPIGFSSAIVPEKWQILFGLNPIVGIIDGFRYALFGDKYPFQPWTLGFTFAVAVILIAIGVSYFRSTERKIVDII